MPPASRNQRVPRAGATPTPAAASSLERPAAINTQNWRRSSRRATEGRPGDRNAPRRHRSERRLRGSTATSLVEVLRRPLEPAQFTGGAFTGVLTRNGIAISMDGKGAWRDNVSVERLWRSVKYEEVYLRAYDTVAEARASIGRYLSFYNTRRPHSSLDR